MSATETGASRPLSLLTGSVPALAQETVLHSFAGASDGANPRAALTNVNGVLYGTTSVGGTYQFGGTVFQIAASGAESVLYRFKGGSDGNYLPAGLTNVNGVLYGVTGGGGDANDDGTVFKITTSGVKTVLYRFAGGSDGSEPAAALIDVNGVLYGTTNSGGDANGDGTVFKITTSGAETVLYRFGGGSDGSLPYAGLTAINGMLYGTTDRGGANGVGTVYALTTSGAESVLHSFGGGSDGEFPYAGLTSVNGALYGTTIGGGADNNGTVFKITTSGNEKVLHSFAGGNDGKLPYAALTNVNGVLYGTTDYGGVNYDTGTVFKITTSGVKSAVYRFGGSDGLGPVAGLTNVNGVLYGTTNQGGANNKGTVFSLSL